MTILTEKTKEYNLRRFKHFVLTKCNGEPLIYGFETFSGSTLFCGRVPNCKQIPFTSIPDIIGTNEFYLNNHGTPIKY